MRDLYPVERLQTCVLPVSTWNPVRDAPNAEFAYIDLGSVDNQAKQITASQTLVGHNAPSRARQLVCAGDVLVATVRPNLNGVCHIPRELDGATASTGFCVLRADGKRLHDRYLFHWVRDPAFVDDMVRKATGASYPAISDRIVLNSGIPLPPLAKQKHLAAILDQADELRRKRRKILEELEHLGRSVFAKMFGAVESKSRRWPEYSLDDLSSKITDGEHLNPPFSGLGMPIVMAGNVGQRHVDLSTAKRVSEELGQRFRKKCAPQRGDLLLVSRGATIGRLCVVDSDLPFCLMGSVILIKPRLELVSSRFIVSLLKIPAMQSRLYNASGASAQQAIYLKDVKRIRCPVPPLALQREFGGWLTQIDIDIDLAQKHLDQLDTLFASLQHRAFRGELTAKAAERELAEVG